MNRPFIYRKGDVLLGYFSDDKYQVRIPADIREIGPRIFDWDKLPAHAYDKIDVENPMPVELIQIPASVEVIAPGAFALQTGVGRIEVDPACPAAVVKDGTLYSRDMKRLITHFDREVDEVIIPEGVETIDDYAFYGCPLSYIEIPETVREIGSYAFAGCRGIDCIEIPFSVEKLGDHPFSFSSIRWTEVSNSSDVLWDTPEGTLTADGKTLLIAFKSDDTGCYRVPDGVTEIDPGAFHQYADVKEIEIPEGVRELKAGTFFWLMGLEKVTLPKSLLHIERDAFTSCTKLKSVNIPEGIAAIDYFAFNGCSSLEKLQMPGTIPDLENDAFAGCDNLTILAPAGSATIAYAKRQGIRYEELPPERGTKPASGIRFLQKGPGRMDSFLYVRSSLSRLFGGLFG